MIEYRTVDLSTYPRIAHLEYFMTMEHPQFNITAEMDVTGLIEFCKKERCSFFLSFLHVVDLSAAAIPQLRQRIHRLTAEELLLPGHESAPKDGTLAGLEIREYVQCPTSHTESAGNGTYGYCVLYHRMPWDSYITDASALQKKARENASLEEDAEIEACFYATCIPWIHYTDVVHPMTDRYDSNPRFSWGKFQEDYRGRQMMPLTLAAHHGLVDGLHAGRFYENVEKNMAALTAGQL